MKPLPSKKDPIEAVGEAYELLLEQAIKEAHKLGDKTGPALHRIIDEVRTDSKILQKFSQEQIEDVAKYLKRDLIDAAYYIKETKEDFKTWFGFDVGLIEDRLKDLFTQAADRTTVELLKLKAEASHEYRTGEITGPGTLLCKECGEKLHFHKPGHIPPCPKCHGTTFGRISSDENA